METNSINLFLKDSFQKPKYNGEKVNCLLKSLRKISIKNRMSLERQNKVEEINNYFVMHKYVTNRQFLLLFKYWFNFVLNDYLDEKRKIK
jgi:hypothetical protein